MPKLEREGVKLIREGAGLVAEFRARRDALMIAKRNAEVAKLNALTRERMKAAGRLRGEEMAVGGDHFGASDQVITGINDQRQGITTASAGKVTEVDAASEHLWLVGIDTRGGCVSAPTIWGAEGEGQWTCSTATSTSGCSSRSASWV